MNILINDVNMSGEGSEEEQIEVIPSTNTSIPTPTSSRKPKKKEFFVLINYPLLNTRHGCKK